MRYYYKCFNKKIELCLNGKKRKKLDFWLERFCPNINIIENADTSLLVDYHIELQYRNTYEYTIEDNKIILYGEKDDYSSYLAKFITQVFQMLLLEDRIIFFPAACVATGDKCLLIIGDFWQGKTASAMYLTSKYKLNLVSDNYVAVKNGKVIAATKYISIRKENVKKIDGNILSINDRLFFNNSKSMLEKNFKIKGFVLPYINSLNEDVHIISKEESKWYLYQKLTRLVNGESILFNGKLPSPSFITKQRAFIILDIVNELLNENNIKYISSNLDIIADESNKIIECIGE